MNCANQSTTEPVCENCGNWQQINDVPHRNRCTQLITRKGILYGISSAEHLETEHLQTWPAFCCPRFEEREQGPFFLIEGRGIGSGWTQVCVRFPGQKPFRLMDLNYKKAPGVCDDLNDRWATHLTISPCST